ncbi:Sensor histidine kinase YycG [Sulfitobacter sp. THAF37]|uniref:PAS domain-containing sensor histidine kinase n=1 Tax=Sulfitobacter sp. THAF37 TaxID=2587855 RepID=UPI0012682F9E|nr:PAS domain-containing sensor histidine kinase [Sulfitobacter sp. THAF37]QFT59566.1 Sensor histidine kinase YycG [Sulfitobacter sp. THAF37]
MSDTDPFSHLDHIATPLFVLEIDGRGLPVYRAFNACARAISGRPLADYLGRTAAEVYDTAYGRTALARHCQVAESGEALTYELQLPLAGEVRKVRTTLSPERDVRGRVARLYGTSLDVTEQARAREAQVSYHTAASEMEQFVAMAAHDLRAPMRNVTMLAEVLKEDFVDHGDGKLAMIDMMDGIADKTMKLIDDILSHAQSVDAEKTEALCDLSEMTCLICDILDPAERHHVTVTPSTLMTDKTALHIALRNLIENAVKHAGRAAMMLDISVAERPDGMIAITLEDNGKGFSEAALRLMNGSSFRVDGGYGLFGVRRIIQARGGTITARNSETTGGAMISFSLPGRVATQGDLPGAPRAPLAGGPASGAPLHHPA